MRRQSANISSVFFFNDTATTEIYTLSLHDALPIYLLLRGRLQLPGEHRLQVRPRRHLRADDGDRKSTRLNSSHANISYAVFCLKKKNVLDLLISIYTQTNEYSVMFHMPK